VQNGRFDAATRGVTKAVSAEAVQSERSVCDYLREEQLNSIASIYRDSKESDRIELDGVGYLSLDDLALLIQECETECWSECTSDIDLIKARCLDFASCGDLVEEFEVLLLKSAVLQTGGGGSFTRPVADSEAPVDTLTEAPRGAQTRRKSKRSCFHTRASYHQQFVVWARPHSRFGP
jgi:hypothetical protein